jgi:tetratricopeptide (TPR) repeat protein
MAGSDEQGLKKVEPRFRWLKVAPLGEPRAAPRCALLADGRVRVVGGRYYDVESYETRTGGVEIYSPEEDRWTKGDAARAVAATPALQAVATRLPAASRVRRKARERPTWTRLPSGHVLVTGGFETTCRFDGEEDNHSLRDVELVDGRSGEVHDAGQLPIGTHDHGVVVLPSGAVLVIGGYDGDTHGSRVVQLGVPAGLELRALGPALAQLAETVFGERDREARLADVRALTTAGQIERALAVARDVAADFPECAAAWRAVGATLAAAERFSEAVEPLRRAVALEPDCPFAGVELADALFLSGAKADARSRYERVVELCRDDSTWTWQPRQRARQQLQFLELESGDVESAARGPGDDATSLEWNNAGAAASKLGRHEDALAAFERATQLDPKNDFAWGNVASTLLVLRRPKDALAAAQNVLALCHDARRKAQAHVSRGIALHDLGQFGESVEAYDASLALHVLPYAWNNRANSLRKLGRDDEALASFERACALGWHAAHWGRACIWVLRGELAQAQAAVDEAARLDPSLVAQMREDEELAPLWSRPGSSPARS